MSQAAMSPRANLNVSMNYRLGCGRRNQLAKEAGALGMSNPLVVTDKGISGLRWFSGMLETAREKSLRFSIFSDIQSNPVEANVTAGLQAYQAGEHDGLVLVGGGSVMDTGKAIALMVGNPGSLFDYEFVGDKWRKIKAADMPAMLAIPTTSGSGSEVSNAAVITDHDAAVKRTFIHPALTPQTVIADPETTFALPPHLTAATGMDALVHSLEALCSPLYNPFADGIAVQAITMLGNHLVACVERPDAPMARTEVMLAAAMGAIAFQKGLGMVHAMAHPLGAATNMHHGLANAILLPYVLRFNQEHIEERMISLAAVLRLPPASNGRASEAVIDWVLELRQKLGIPNALQGLSGITDTSTASSWAELAMQEATYMPTNPRKPTVGQVADVYCRAITGTL